MKQVIILKTPKPVLVHTTRLRGTKVWQTMLLIELQHNSTRAVLLLDEHSYTRVYHPIEEVFEIPVIDLVPVNISDEPVYLEMRRGST